MDKGRLCWTHFDGQWQVDSYDPVLCKSTKRLRQLLNLSLPMQPVLGVCPTLEDHSTSPEVVQKGLEAHIDRSYIRPYDQTTLPSTLNHCLVLNHPTLRFLLYLPCRPTCKPFWSSCRWITIYPVCSLISSIIKLIDQRSCHCHCCRIWLPWVMPVFMLSFFFWSD